MDELCSLALRDVPLRRVLFANDVNRHVGAVVKKLTKRDQQSTGLCWMYAGLAYIEAEHFSKDDGDEKDKEKSDVPDVNTLFHPDFGYLYKRNLKRLVRVVRKRLEDPLLDERTRYHLLEEGIEDGGLWGMFTSLIDEEGVPLLRHEKTEWPRSVQKSSQLTRYLSAQLRNGATMDEMDATIDRCIGPDSTHEHVRVWRPERSLKQDTWQILNAPDRECDKWYSSPYSNDPGVLAQDPALNVDIDVFVKSCKKMLAAKKTLWASFAVDLWFDRSRQAAGGAQSHVVPPVPFKSKAERMRNRDMKPNHAMLIVGVAESEEHGTRWRIHNSWGKRSKEKYAQEHAVAGEMHGKDHTNVVVTDEWFRMHVFHAVLHCDVIPRPEAPMLLEDVRVLPIWDVLSSVARSGVDAFPSSVSVIEDMFPYDVVETIAHHCCASVIQSAARRHMFRHARTPDWKRVRRLIMQHSASALPLLQQCPWVRSEWRTEPGSWIYTLEHDHEEFDAICVELLQIAQKM